MYSIHFAWSSVSVRPAETVATAALTRSSAVSSGDVSVGCPLHHRDDVDQRLVVGDVERLLEIRLREVLRRVPERLAQFFERLGAPVRWPRQQNTDGLDLVGVFSDELLEELEVVLGLVLLADAGLDEPLRLDGVGDAWRDDERALGPRVVRRAGRGSRCRGGRSWCP